MEINRVRCPVIGATVSRVVDFEGETTRVICAEYDERTAAAGARQMSALIRDCGFCLIDRPRLRRDIGRWDDPANDPHVSPHMRADFGTGQAVPDSSGLVQQRKPLGFFRITLDAADQAHPLFRRGSGRRVRRRIGLRRQRRRGGGQNEADEPVCSEHIEHRRNASARRSTRASSCV